MDEIKYTKEEINEIVDKYYDQYIIYLINNNYYYGESSTKKQGKLSFMEWYYINKDKY